MGAAEFDAKTSTEVKRAQLDPFREFCQRDIPVDVLLYVLS
jgi:hypothetical protein